MKKNIFKNKQFNYFFASFTSGNLGDWFDIFAVQIIFAHHFSASPFLLGVTLVMYILPGTLVGPLLGAFVDTYKNKKQLLIVTDLICALLTLGLIASGSILLSLSLLLIRSTLASINGLGQNATLKYIVSDEEMLEASSYTSISMNLCKVLGPLLGASIALMSTAYICLWINVGSFLLSVFFLLFISARTFILNNNVETILDESERYFTKIMRGFKIIKQNQQIRLVMLLILPFMLFYLMGEAQMVILLKVILPHKTDILGLIIGVSAIGSVLSGVWMSRQEKMPNMPFLAAVSYVLFIVAYVTFSNYQADWPLEGLLSAALIQGVGLGILVVMYSAILRQESPHESIGTVMGISALLTNSLMVLGSLISGIIVMWIGVRAEFCMIAGGSLIMAIFAQSLYFLNKNRRKYNSDCC